MKERFVILSSFQFCACQGGASALLQSSTKDFVQLLGEISSGGDQASKSTIFSSKKRPTLGSQFSSQLSNLLRRIGQTKPHYIRCLKPNQSLKPNDFECAMIGTYITVVSE